MPNPFTSHGRRPFTSSVRRRRHHHHHRRRMPPKPKPDPNTNQNPPPKLYMRSTILRSSPWPTVQSLPIRWDSFTVTQLLKTHLPLEKSWLFFNWAPSKIPTFKHDKFTYTTMLDIFGVRISSMRHLYEQMVGSGVDVDGVTFTSIMHWLAKAGDVEGGGEGVGGYEEIEAVLPHVCGAHGVSCRCRAQDCISPHRCLWQNLH